MPDEHALVDSRVRDHENDFLVQCNYQRADIEEDGEDMILVDHVRITSEIILYRGWEDTHYGADYPELPVGSDDIEDWRAQTLSSTADPLVWWEGCGPGIPCAGSEEPTHRTHAKEQYFEGHVGNLVLRARIVYIAQRLPPDVETRVLVIFRELALATVDIYPRAD